MDDDESYFFAEQNARVVKNAEEYYRAMYEFGANTWNLRDTHMADTLDEIITFLEKRQKKSPKIVVWEHNSHIGDARATEMGRQGELNLGQLVRERYPGKSALIGFTTSTGSVTAASDWDTPSETKQVRPPLHGSVEKIFQRTGIAQFFLNLRKHRVILEELNSPRLERAIGVIYRPETERYSHYFSTRIADQFDGIIHIDNTTAVKALEPISEKSDEPDETFPFAV